MKREQKIAISVIALLALLIALRIAIISHVFDYNPPPPSVIDNIKSTSPIYFDAAVDKDQNIHLLWATQEKVPAYQKSTDGGKTWSLYHKFDDMTGLKRVMPRIFAVDDVLVMLWTAGGSLFQRMSLDGGVNWQDTKEVMARTQNEPIYGGREIAYRYKIDEMAKTPGQLNSVLISDGTIYIVYADVNRQGLYFSKSGNYGETWSEPKMLLSAIEWSYCRPQLASAISGEKIHIVYKRAKPEEPNSSRVYYLYSPDKGENWVHKEGTLSDRIIADSTSGFAEITGGPILAAIGDTLISLILNDYPLCYSISYNKGNTWQPPKRLKGVNSMAFAHYAQSTEGIVVAWVDRRNEEQDWWGYIPLHEILTWDTGPEWSNNDLYYIIIRGEKVTKEVRLTPQLSYVEMSDPATSTLNTIKCLPLGNKMIVFWAGKRKVGKDFFTRKPDPPDCPFEIFFKPLKTD